MKKTSMWIRALALLAIVGILLYIFRMGFTLDQVRALVYGFGMYTKTGFVIVYAVLAAMLLPGTILTVSGGLLFGTLIGTALNVLGATLGATIGFFIARKLGKDAFEFVSGAHIKKLEKHIKKGGLEGVLILRLLPLVPFNALNYGLGLTNLKARHFIFGTLIGIIPGTFVYTYAAATVGEAFLMKGFAALTPMDWTNIGISVGLLVLLIALPFIMRKFRKK